MLSSEDHKESPKRIQDPAGQPLYGAASGFVAPLSRIRFFSATCERPQGAYPPQFWVGSEPPALG